MKKIDIVESQPNICLKDIKKFENLIEAKLPSDYKDFLLKANGGSGAKYAFPLIEPTLKMMIYVKYYYKVW
jgi:hypothetical protein